MADHVERDGDPLARYSLSPGELKQLLGADRDGEPFLVFRDEQSRLAIFRTGTGGEIRTVGRRAEMDLSIPWDSEVSGLHAELQDIGGEWTIVDDGLSTNGTYVNGQRVGGRRRLRDGDRIRIGRTILAYRAGTATPVEKTVSTGERRILQHLTDTQRRVLIALCRPYRSGGSFSTPATNQQIADEVFLSVEAVKMHLRTLFGKFELGELPQNEKRVRLAECALQFGVISQRDSTDAALRRDGGWFAGLGSDRASVGSRAGRSPRHAHSNRDAEGLCARVGQVGSRLKPRRGLLRHPSRDHFVDRCCQARLQPRRRRRRGVHVRPQLRWVVVARERHLPGEALV